MSGYTAQSVLTEEPDGAHLELATALGLTPSGLVDNPVFFTGFVTRPDIAAAGLLAVADIAASRYADVGLGARLAKLDPVVTAGGDRLRFESLTRYNPENAQLRMAFESATLQPNNTWSWSFAYFYLRDYYSATDPTAWGEGTDNFLSTIFYRFDDNWGFRLTHRYDLREGQLSEQAYSIYRDLRSWTAALTLRLREDQNGKDDVTVAFVFSIKAFPRFGVGGDASTPRMLWGG